MIVVDASVLAPALGDGGDDGRAARRRLHDGALAAPELVDLEVTSVFRRLLGVGSISADRAAQALRDLTNLPLQRAAHRSLLPRCWELRDNLTPSDASYVALAELLGAPLITADARLARAPGVRCDVEVLRA